MELFVGTSGFSYPAWRGSFYPESLPAADIARRWRSGCDWDGWIDEDPAYTRARLTAVDRANLDAVRAEAARRGAGLPPPADLARLARLRSCRE